MRKLSPTANLLRTSRLFSLPPPLPRPAPDLSAILNFDSNTSTTPYPTHAAIETTQASLARGDWGLKRALPLKSTTKTSTPIIHIANVDSIDHITDFGSSADQALTLRKWQQLDLPISIAQERDSTQHRFPVARSVFDSQYDNTDTSDTKSSRSSSRKRWKYKGPWLAGKTNGEFNDYLEKKVKRRKKDFRRYLGKHLSQMRTSARRREAVEKGEGLEELTADEVPVSEEDIDAYARHLRHNEQDLHRLVEEYLDLPRDQGLGGTSSVSAEKGPPTTHPSAGLSYLRTASHVYNHPELGPQENKAPIQGRVIIPQKQGKLKMNLRALIGIAGVVGIDNVKTFFTEPSLPGLGHYDPDIPGGGKLWTHPMRANVNSDGRIELYLDRADKNAMNVAMGIHSTEPKLPTAAITSATDREIPDLAPSRPTDREKGRGYGLEDVAGVQKSGRATPLLGPDDEVPDGAFNDLLRRGIQATGR